MRRPKRLWVLAGLALFTMGLASLVIGLLNLSATVEGAYFNRAADATSGGGVYVTFVEGKGWLFVGTALVAVGGAMLAGAALKRS